MDLHLISFKTCPYVQRSVITLRYKDIPFRITHIDLADPPEWFDELSPFGKVPVLVVDEKTVLFESAVINEYIDEVTPGRLLPEDPLERALNRAWIEFGSVCMGDVFNMIMAKTEGRYESNRDELIDRFERLEQVLGEGPFFNGEGFSLVDTAYAPLFVRLHIIGKRHQIHPADEFPRIARWSARLRGLPAVRSSMVADFEEILLGRIASQQGYAAELLGGGRKKDG